MEQRHISYARNNPHQKEQGSPEKLNKCVHNEKCLFLHLPVWVILIFIFFFFFFFLIERKQTAQENFDPCQLKLQTDSTAH